MEASSAREPTLHFGPFELQPDRRLLLDGGRRVRLGSRALDLLCALLERAGEIVSREALVAKVWPHTVVEETSLRVHISTLRKALGDGQNGARYISNVPGRGYAFVAPVATKAVPASPPIRNAPAHPWHLPPRLTRVIGRSELVASLIQQLHTRRLVSIVGAGGMGKTTVALAVAERCQDAYQDGACLVDLAPVGSASQVPSALGRALGLHLAEESSWSDLGALLHHRRMLIVMDNCEHVIDVAATLCEQILRTCPGVDILATSREALDAEGEWVHRLAGLSTPAAEAALPIAAAMNYSAVQLFVERAMANSDAFMLTEQNVGTVAQLCVQLDGMPLAIELAAGRVDTFGLQGLAARLSDLFRGLAIGRRTALPRHRTLQALLAWSHDLLCSDEQAVLRRLAVFRTRFTLDSAVAVVADAALLGPAVIECLASLSAKSLVAADTNTDIPQHRLLFTTRHYAMGKLVDSGELDVVKGRHAVHFREMSRSWSREFRARPSAHGAARFHSIVEDVRAALDWSFSPGGDESIGIALTSETLELRLSQDTVDEFRRHVDLALDRVTRLQPPRPDLELRLATACYHLSGQSPTQAGRQAEIRERLLTLCDSSTHLRDRIEAFHALLAGAFGQGHYDQVKAVVERLRPLATGRWESLQVILCDRFQLMADHFLGDHAAAKPLFDKVACFEVRAEDRWFVGRVPRTVSMRIYRARIHWIEGEANRAMQLALEAVDFGAQSHPFALIQALGMAAIPIALWRADDALARRLLERLVNHIRRYAVSYWWSIADSFRHVLDQRSRPQSNGENGLNSSAWQLSSNAMELDLIATLSEDLVTPQALARADAGLAGWCAPEVIRANACAGLAAGLITSAEAQRAFERALVIAREQGALAWELRAAISLARLWGRGARERDATALLSGVVGRFTEGFETGDLLSARALLAAHAISGERYI